MFCGMSPFGGKPVFGNGLAYPKIPYFGISPTLTPFITLRSSENCKNRTTLPKNNNVQ
jgi:hypothetical protein